MNRLLILAVATWSGVVAAAGTLTIRARVVDGDTLELADGNRVRLWGIDAVEGSQVCRRDGRPWRCGDDATEALRRLIDGRKLACEARDVDRYGRAVAVCRVDGADIGAELVRQGWALDDERYSRRCLCRRTGGSQGRAGGAVGGRVRFAVGVARAAAIEGMRGDLGPEPS